MRSLLDSASLFSSLQNVFEVHKNINQWKILILSPGFHMNILCTLSLDTLFFISMFFGFSLSTLMIFLILNLYYSYSMLEIKESVVSHEICHYNVRGVSSRLSW